MASSSNIRVFVQWSEQTVFAGEDIECEITFKNVTALPDSVKNGTQTGLLNGTIPADRTRKTPPFTAAATNIRRTTPSRPPPPNRGHKSTLSLNLVTGDTRYDRGSDGWKDSHSKTGTEGGAHRRSVSIISLGQSESALDDTKSQGSFTQGPRRPVRGHGRAASLQILPRRSNMAPAAGGNGGLPSAPLTNRSTTQPSPLFHSSSAFDMHRPPNTAPIVPSRKNSNMSARNSPSPRRQAAASFGEGFKFPAAPPPVDSAHPEGLREDGSVSPFIGKLLSPRPRESVPAIMEQTTPATRVLSPVSHGGTPRSSGEFYSLSNNSTETLASEYLPQQQAKQPFRGPHTRRVSNLVPTNFQRTTETLMMGYAQIAGSFTVDGSLISQAPFEEVKRKGVVGGQGGGVIGVETNKRDSSMLRGFGWGNIGESLSGFLGGGELSSIKEMRGTVGSKTIPLLSTPQSILFVDLKLSPGESRSFQYCFKLPRGLPPTHRGKAIKIIYNLVIGTQRPGGSKEQQVRSVEVPFRVLGSVNNHGELLGHDLMSPYVLLRDQARVRSVNEPSEARHKSSQSKGKSAKETKLSQDNLNSFLSYVDELLAKPRQNSSLGLLSPTADLDTHRLSDTDEPATAKEAIDMAIIRSNLATEQQQSANRFEIARNGRRVAVIMLARPSYRLGETITAAVDFTDAEIPCYAIHASLETSEKVDASIALRSDASIHRVTRKVHSSHSESTLFARRILFTPTVSLQASPSFITSSISLEWKVLIEFVTPRYFQNSDGLENPSAELLEEISRDDRGLIMAAVERLDCESFEIAVPIRIYGASGGNFEKDSAQDGLAV